MDVLKVDLDSSDCDFLEAILAAGIAPKVAQSAATINTNWESHRSCVLGPSYLQYVMAFTRFWRFVPQNVRIKMRFMVR